ncbi:hypothetical protein [Nocardioides sp. NPDC047086]|uniref:hypothetical protein n=1 Tax=Nocardioides sp. NPDC047086 TaxID=3154810 RepID=UPI00340A7EAB
MKTNTVPVCVLDEYGCPLILACGHYWRRCAPGCPGWGGFNANIYPNIHAAAAALRTARPGHAAAIRGVAA